MNNTHTHHGCYGMHGGQYRFPPYLSQFQNFMPYDLDETSTNYIVTMALPGFDVKDIEVSVKGHTVLVEAKKARVEADEAEEAEKPEMKKLVSMGDFVWNRDITVKVPVEEEIDADHVKAKLEKGMLRIEFQKKPGTAVNIEE